MDYSQYQNMAAYGSSAASNCPEMYPGYCQMGQGQRFGESRGYDNGQQWASEEPGPSQGGSSAAYGGAGYRNPMRYAKQMREVNSRNGLYSPSERSAGGYGDGLYYNTLPGLGGAEGQTPRRTRPGGNPFY